MTDEPENDAPDAMQAARERILAAATPHIPFDGWSQEAIDAAAAAAGIDKHVAKLAFPRGGVDLALFQHREGDRALAAELAGLAASGALRDMRVRERVALAVRRRLEIAEPQREAVRRAAALFALPIHAADGARAIWETADVIWTALGDSSEDLNWYTKRAILSGVISASVLYWLNDESAGREASWAFVDRRIDDVMRFEKMKATLNANPLGRLAMAGPNWLASRIRKPGGGGAEETGAPSDLPG